MGVDKRRAGTVAAERGMDGGAGGGVCEAAMDEGAGKILATAGIEDQPQRTQRAQRTQTMNSTYEIARRAGDAIRAEIRKLQAALDALAAISGAEEMEGAAAAVIAGEEKGGGVGDEVKMKRHQAAKKAWVTIRARKREAKPKAERKKPMGRAEALKTAQYAEALVANGDRVFSAEALADRVHWTQKQMWGAVCRWKKRGWVRFAGKNPELGRMYEKTGKFPKGEAVAAAEAPGTAEAETRPARELTRDERMEELLKRRDKATLLGDEALIALYQGQIDAMEDGD